MPETNTIIIGAGAAGLAVGVHLKLSGNRIIFEGGKEADLDAVILATGYRSRVSDFLQSAPSAFDEDGTPTSSGKESSIPGLYFYGYYVSPTGMLREIAIEARQISDSITKRIQ